MNAFVPALLVKLTLILAIGLALAASFRNSSASLRHMILFATLVSGLALPAAMLLTPRWNVPVLSAASPTRVEGLTAPEVKTFSDAAPLDRTGVLPATRENALRIPAPAAALPLVWIVGVLSVLAWLAIGRIRLGRIAATSWSLNDTGWRTLLDDEQRKSGVERPVRLCSSSVVSTPLTWGSRAPVILLPEDALDWPEAHRRVVLRHELAHIARSDARNQLIAGFACALYWFHPFVWIVERRMRAECERACDDRVVLLGTPAPDYAAHLLEVARSARAFGAPGFLSVAMARPSQLEGRLLAVLNESRRRVSVSPAARRVAVVLSALVLLPVAAFRPVAKPARTPEPIVSSAESTKASMIASPLTNAPAPVSRPTALDTTFELSAPARNGGTLELDLKTGGRVVITGWNQQQIVVHASLAGRDWRETEVKLEPSNGDVMLRSEFTRKSNSQSTRHRFDIQVPRNYNVRLKSSGGAISIAEMSGRFTGQTGGGEINIARSNGEVDLQTGGGEINVTNSNLDGSVSTGGGLVRIIGVNGNLSGHSGSGPVVYTNSSGEKVTSSGYGIGKGRRAGGAFAYSSAGITMNTAGGPLTLATAPNGARLTTGGGPIRIGASNGEVFAKTGGGHIDIGPAGGSVAAHTGAGDVTIELKGAGSHTVDVTDGKGDVTLILPADLNATLDLETAYTNNFRRKTRVVSDWPVTSTETADWDAREGTPRRYVRVRQTIGRGGGVIRVRTVNGDIMLNRAR
ncbi:MAG: M56 family metallopeptidase [Gemmatimonadaceae bacterium]